METGDTIIDNFRKEGGSYGLPTAQVKRITQWRQAALDTIAGTSCNPPTWRGPALDTNEFMKEFYVQEVVDAFNGEPCHRVVGETFAGACFVGHIPANDGATNSARPRHLLQHQVATKFWAWHHRTSEEVATNFPLYLTGLELAATLFGGCSPHQGQLTKYECHNCQELWHLLCGGNRHAGMNYMTRGRADRTNLIILAATRSKPTWAEAMDAGTRPTCPNLSTPATSTTCRPNNGLWPVPSASALPACASLPRGGGTHSSLEGSLALLMGAGMEPATRNPVIPEPP